MTISLDTLKNEIETYFNEADFNGKSPVRLYEPITYILGLKGKRLRPLLAMIAYHIVSGNPPREALSLGSSIELFHNFTLIHDDIMDNAPTRRGKATVHEKWDTNVGILSGDAIFAISVQWLVREFPDKAATLVSTFTQAAIEVCEGQQEDMDLATQESVKIEDYIEMIRKKTSVLLGAALKLGAISGGASHELAAAFYNYGIQAGIGFQLQDDLMDAFPPEGFGKQKGGDIIENKKTFLWLKAFERASDAQKSALTALMSEANQEKKVNEVIAIFKALNIPEETERLVAHYFQLASATGEIIRPMVKDFSLMSQLLYEISQRKI